MEGEAWRRVQDYQVGSEWRRGGVQGKEEGIGVRGSSICKGDMSGRRRGREGVRVRGRRGSYQTDAYEININFLANPVLISRRRL